MVLGEALEPASLPTCSWRPGLLTVWLPAPTWAVGANNQELKSVSYLWQM